MQGGPLSGGFRLLLVCCLFLVQPAGSLPAAAARQGRALWVVRHTLLSRESIDNLVERSARAGFDNLFVQVCGRGDAFFPSKVFPRAESYARCPDPAFDPLAYLLDKAHARGIKVHAWVNTLLVWSSPKPPADPSHVLNAHPEWMMVDRQGVSLARYSRSKFNKLGVTGVFMSVAEPEARGLVCRFLLDLAARYPVDGIHFDYLRYPMSSVDFNPGLRREFQAAYGVDPLELAALTAGRSSGSNAENARLERAWTAFRAEAVSRFLREVATALNEKKPGLVRSAAVKPDIDSAFRVFGQQWPLWVREGLVDLVLPMAYSTDRDKVYGQIAQACEAVGAGHVWAGLRAYDVPVAGIVERVRRIKSLQPAGYCFFSYNGVENIPGFFESVPKELVP
ncbi:MAG: family 10 glycosylhydrolase [Candidatus Glassbacteria bacterium]|nr:family 10 glycosylhydrolase [Candidatus Glassbacteria bacterium]